MKLSPELEAAILSMPGVKVHSGPPLPCAPEPMPPEIGEKEFQAKVIEYAESRGFLCYHTFDSRRSKAGFPDLVCVRERAVWIELKAESGTLSKAQREWRDALKRAGAEWWEFRPSDWETIKEELL